MEHIFEKVNKVKTKDDFIEFLGLLLNDFQENKEEWENKDLSSYLEAMASWTEDMEGYYSNLNIDIPEKIEWRVFANILFAAKMYE